MNKKKIIIGGAIGVLAVCGIVFGVRKYMASRSDGVEVTQVSMLNSMGWGDMGTSYGVITANAAQQEYVDSEQSVTKVYVKEGDRVSVGDKLFEYDKSLLELNYESAKLDRQITELEIQGAENDLKKLQGTTPIADSEGDDSADSLDDLDDSYLDDDDDDDEARGNAGEMIQNVVSMVAAEILGDGTAGIQSQEGETEIISEGGIETEETAETQTETESEAPILDAPDDGGGIEEEVETETESELPEDGDDGGETKADAYKRLTYKSQYYKGKGTQEDPYVYFCVDGATIRASFMNMIFGFNSDGSSRAGGGVTGNGKGSYARLEIREGDSLAGGFIKSMVINGTVETENPFDPDVTWTFTSNGIERHDPESDDSLDDDDYLDDSDVFDDGDVYTASELKKAIKDKEDEIKSLKLDLRENKLDVKKAKRQVKEAIVTSTINGVVKTIGDPEAGYSEDEPFCVVNSDKGMYVKGTVSETKLNTIQKGSVISGIGEESGLSFVAEVTEVSVYPSDGDDYFYGYGDSTNPNSSSYPFMAYIEDSEGLINDESASIQMDSSEAVMGDEIYLDKMYIRTEGGQSYVYKEGDEGTLVKQYIRTGQTLYDTVIEVKEGITNDDWIAFPYGKEVKEGAKVKETDGTGAYGDLYY